MPKLGELLGAVDKWAKTNLGVKLPRFFSVGMSASTMKGFLRLQRAVKPGDRKAVDALISLSPYFSENRQFQRSNLDELLGPYNMNWHKMLPHLLEYATYHGFLHRSERTVHEQVLYRLESKSLPVTYYDIIEDKIVKKTAEQMRNEILSAAAALRSMGISVGDRVALTGLNCSDYLAADVAIGLVGAISVPLYYTTPPADINQVLKASESKLFFVGMPSLLARIDELTADVPIVSFCRGAPSQNGKVIAWTGFPRQSNI